MAKRVNTRFLIILTVIAVAGGAAAFIAPMVLRQHDAGPTVAEARQASKQGDWAQSRLLYVRALRIEKNNPQLLVELGDVYAQTARQDREDAGKDLRAWRQALEVNPKFMPALTRMFDTFVEITRLEPRNIDAWNELGQRARAMQAADPSNAKAAAYEQIAVIGAWAAGGPVVPEKAEAAVKALAPMAGAHPEIADIPFWIAQARIRQMADARKNNNPDIALAKRTEAIAAFDAPLKAAPDDVALLWRYHQVLLATADLNGDGSPDKAELDKAYEVLRHAYGKVKPQDPDYADVMMRWSGRLAQQDQFDQAEELGNELLKQRPNDMLVRLHLADLLRNFPRSKQPAALQRAIGLVSEPVDDPSLKGFKARRIDLLELMRRVRLTQLRIDAYPQITGEKERKAAMAQIEEGYHQAEVASRPEEPAILKLRANMLLLNNDASSIIEAIRLMQLAVDRLTQRGGQAADLAELYFQLAQANLSRQIDQPGQARQYLGQLVAMYPGATMYRKMYGQVLLRERMFEPAKEQIDRLMQDAKDDPAVGAMYIQWLLGTNKTEQAKELVAKMEEGTAAQKGVKAEFLLAVGEQEKAMKLLEPLAADELKADGEQKFAYNRRLLQVYWVAKRKDDARAVADRVLAKNPADKVMWETTRKGILGEVTVQNIEENLLEGAKTPAQKADAAIQIANLANEQGKPAEALEKLLAAEKETQEPRVTEEVFTQAMAMANWKLAEDYAARLTKLNRDQSGGLSYRVRLELAHPGGAAGLRDALKNAQELSRRMEQFAWSWMLLGQAQEALGQYDNAIGSFQKAIDRQPNNAQAIRGLIECYEATNQIELAKGVIRQRGLTLPGYAAYFEEMRRQLAETYEDPGTVTELREKDYKAHPEAQRVYMQLSENYTRCADRLDPRKDGKKIDGLLSKAQEVLLAATQRWPDDSLICGKLADICLRRSAANKEQVGPMIEVARASLEKLGSREKWKNRPEPDQMMAVFYQRLGKPNEAEKSLLAAMKKSNNGESVRKQMVGFYYHAGKIDKAIELLKGLVEQTHNADYRTQLVEVLMRAGKADEAERIVKEVLAGTPDDAKALSLMAFLKMNSGQVAEARTYIAEALKADPRQQPALYYRGMIKLNVDGDLSGAEKDLTDARDLDPSSLETHVALAEIYRRRNQLSDSSSELEQAVQIAPDRKDLRVKLLDQYASESRWVPYRRLVDAAKADADLADDPTWWRMEAQMYVAQNDFDQAMVSISHALNMNSKDEKTQQLFCTLLLHAGSYDQLLSVTDGAQKEAASMRWWLMMDRAIAYKEKGQAKEAGEALDQALNAVDEYSSDSAASVLAGAMGRVLGLEATAAKLAPRAKPYWAVELAQTYAAGMKWEKAVAAGDDAIKAYDPYPPEVRARGYNVAGQIYAAAAEVVPGARAKAEKTLVEYLQLAGNRPDTLGSRMATLNNLASLFVEGKEADAKRALKYSSQAYELMRQINTFNSSVADTHGWALAMAGQIDQGMNVLQQVVESEKPIPDSYYHLGQICVIKASAPDVKKNANQARGLCEQAKGYFDQAQALVKKTQDRHGYVDPMLEGKISAAREKLKTMEGEAAAASASPGQSAAARN